MLPLQQLLEGCLSAWGADVRPRAWGEWQQPCGCSLQQGHTVQLQSSGRTLWHPRPSLQITLSSADPHIWSLCPTAVKTLLLRDHKQASFWVFTHQLSM